MLISCKEAAWGFSREEILTLLAAGDTAFLADVAPDAASQALKIGLEAPWFLAQHARAEGNLPLMLALLETGIKHSSEPFSILCVRDLVRVGTSEQGLDALKRLSLPDPIFPTFSLEAPTLKAAILADEGRFDEIPDGVEDFFYRTPLSESLISIGTKISFPNSIFSRIFTLRQMVYLRAYGPAWEVGKELLNEDNPELFHRSILSDLGRAALYSANDLDEALLLFTSLFEKTAAGTKIPAQYAEESVGYMLSFYRGRLLARQGSHRYEDARSVFEIAYTHAGNPFDRDVALWYLLDLSSDNPQRLFKDLIHYAPLWDDPAFFSGIIDRLIVGFVQDRDWKALRSLYVSLHDWLDRETLARLAYITAKTGGLNPQEEQEGYRIAFEEDHGSLYYRVLAREALQIDPGTVADIISFSPSLHDPNEIDAGGRKAALETVLRGFITYSLPQRVYSFAREHYPDISPELATDLADGLSRAGEYSAALRLTVLSVRAARGPVTEQQLAYLYPRPWLEEVSVAAKRFDLPEYLIYALIRSESFFEASVVSHAGAIGLTQLMKPTAGDIARKLKVSDYDLIDPETNITFGSFYLAELIRRLDGDTMAALFSYNAGITRVRSWQRKATGLDPVLFLESLPFSETREYGRKVLAAAVVYGYLYYQKSPGQIVRELF
ncbi:MAG TPA: lytic transglycosylase domain-containing protein [Treponema sp.]|nr:lytic transglycosylase domain-containing protein [Treponema sp.]